MKFDNELSIIQQKIANGYAGVSRRLAIMNSLDIEIGQNVIDIGCGGGHLVQEIALGVGENGSSIGIDPSKDQLKAANDRCKNLNNVELICCTADKIDIEKGFCDRVTSTQTLEYIDDVDLSLNELKRISKKNSKFVNISILWDYFRFYGPEKKLNDLIHEAFRAHCFHQMLPMELSHLLPDSGFGSITRQNLSYIETTLHAGMAGFYLSKLMALFATTQGVSDTDAELWLSQLQKADDDGRFGFVNFPVLTMATAI